MLSTLRNFPTNQPYFQIYGFLIYIFMSRISIGQKCQATYIKFID